MPCCAALRGCRGARSPQVGTMVVGVGGSHGFSHGFSRMLRYILVGELEDGPIIPADPIKTALERRAALENTRTIFRRSG